MMAVVGRKLAGWNPVFFSVQIWLCLVGWIQQSVQAQTQCDPTMCDHPPSTLSSHSIGQYNCYYPSHKITILCNKGFRQFGDNYTAICSSTGVWDSEHGCRIDLFTVIVAASASLLAIFIFSILFVIICACCASKRKRHSIAKIEGKQKKQGKRKKREARHDTDMELGAANGQGFSNGRKGHGGHTTHHADDDEYIDDFSDDEDEIVLRERPATNTECIYMNHAVNM